VEATTEVARFYAHRDFTVPSRSAVEGLRLEATDGPFRTGSGPLVSGTTVALTMVMAGRSEYCDDLTGAGVTTLRPRLRPGLFAGHPDFAGRPDGRAGWNSDPSEQET